MVFLPNGTYRNPREWRAGRADTCFSLEGPLKNGKTTFLVSDRRGNLDLFSRLSSLPSSSGDSVVGSSFYDISATVSHPLTPRAQLLTVLYLGGHTATNRRRAPGELRYQYTSRPTGE